MSLRPQLKGVGCLSGTVLRRTWVRRQRRGMTEALLHLPGALDEALDSLTGSRIAGVARRVRQGCSLRRASKASPSARMDPPSHCSAAMAAKRRVSSMVPRRRQREAEGSQSRTPSAYPASSRTADPSLALRPMAASVPAAGRWAVRRMGERKFGRCTQRP